MATKEILLYPKHKNKLREKSAAVGTFNRQTRRLITDLKDTLAAHPDGIGLAAPQIGECLRVVIVCLGVQSNMKKTVTPPIAFVNPEIIESGESRKDFDGCLSFPGLFGETVRPHYLRIKGISENGKTFDRVFSGFDAVVVHHEIDHLDGVLFIDHIESPEDLYRVWINEAGKPVRVPVSDFLPAIKTMSLAE